MISFFRTTEQIVSITNLHFIEEETEVGGGSITFLRSQMLLNCDVEYSWESLGLP